LNYYKESQTEYTVSPLRLKEYLNRWYLIAVPDGLDEIRTFGLDRLANLKVLNTKARKIKNEKQQLKQFMDVIGLNYSESEEVQKVVLKADTRQIKYLRSLPLHHSQLCADGATLEDWRTVSYELKPNFEFMTQILKLGARVKVIEPTALKERVEQEIGKMNELYTK